MIRKLYFQNAAGIRWGLNGDRGVYAHALAGFGFTLSPGFADLNRGFFIPVSDESEPQGTLPFTITFTKNPYGTYRTFVNWLAAAGTVTLVYDPTGTQEFCRDVIVNFFQKGEKNAVGWLEVPCSFYCKTPWYLPSPTSLDLDAVSEDETKRYDYYYGGSGNESYEAGILGMSLLGEFILGEDPGSDLIYGDDSSATLSGTIAGAGHIPGSLELTYHGGIINPKIRLTGSVSGKTYGVCSVTAVLAPSDTLKFSTKYDNAYVKKISAGGAETDLLDALDLSTTPFFHIPVDEPCVISIEADTVFTGSADLLIYYYYRSV